MTKKSVIIAACGLAVAVTFGLRFVPAGHDPFAARFPFVPEVTSSVLPVEREVTEPRLCGVTYDPADPYRLTAQFEHPKGRAPDRETKERLVRYFLAALTVPDAQQWVNLSPYEADRVMPAAYAATDAGADLLAEDLTLKHVAATATDPRTPLGKAFWKDRDPKSFSFDKVWIVPTSVAVSRHAGEIRVSAPRFSVRGAQDGVAASAEGRSAQKVDHAYDAVKAAIEADVAGGVRFERLRQVYLASVLAREFRAVFNDVPLVKGYAGANRVGGIDTMPASLKSRMHAVYADAYERGTYALTSREGKVVRRYACGGIVVAQGVSQRGAFVPRRGCAVSDAIVELRPSESMSASAVVAEHVTAAERAVAAQFAGVPVVTYVYDPLRGEDDAGISAVMAAAYASGMFVRFDLSALESAYHVDPAAAVGAVRDVFLAAGHQFSPLDKNRLNEALRNAFAHGNKYDIRYPIWLRFTADGMTVVDCAVARARSAGDAARGYGMSGGRNGMVIAVGGMKRKGGGLAVHQTISDPITGVTAANVFAVQKTIEEYGKNIALLDVFDPATPVLPFGEMLATRSALGGVPAVRWVVPDNVYVPNTETAAHRFDALIKRFDRYRTKYFANILFPPLVTVRGVGNRLLAQAEYVVQEDAGRFEGIRTGRALAVPAVRQQAASPSLPVGGIDLTGGAGLADTPATDIASDGYSFVFLD